MEVSRQGLDVKVFHGAEGHRWEGVVDTNILAPDAVATKRPFYPQRRLIGQNSVSSHVVDAVRHETGVHVECVSTDCKDAKHDHGAKHGLSRLAGLLASEDFSFGFQFVDVILFRAKCMVFGHGKIS